LSACTAATSAASCLGACRSPRTCARPVSDARQERDAVPRGSVFVGFWSRERNDMDRQCHGRQRYASPATVRKTCRCSMPLRKRLTSSPKIPTAYPVNPDRASIRPFFRRLLGGYSPQARRKAPARIRKTTSPRLASSRSIWISKIIDAVSAPVRAWPERPLGCVVQDGTS
jgi:hypothetical protein